MPLLRPTAGQADFDSVPGLPEAWSDFLNHYLEKNIYGVAGDDELAAIEQLKQWGRSDSDLKFYNPLSMPEPAGTVSKNVNWKALPTRFDGRFGDDREALYDFLDNPDPGQGRQEDEYCEWAVLRNGAGKIVKVIFTSEPADYYSFLFNDEFRVGLEKTRELLVKLYNERCEGEAVALADLVTRDGRYNPWNRWNNKYAVHMQQENNSLYAQVNIAAISAILRQDRTGRLITDALGLINCGGYGVGQRQSDPAIGAAVNSFARENRFITLEDPIGLYMTGLDTTGWRSPDRANPKGFWTVTKGSANADPDLATIVRAEFAVPAARGYTVSEITIGGAPIRFGAQIAAKVNMRIGVRVSPPADVPPARAIGCVDERPVLLSRGGGISGDTGRR